MGWFQTGLVAAALLAGSGAHATPDKHPQSTPKPDGVVASCDDFVHVADEVFTGRTGAYFAAGKDRQYLGGDTFGRSALSIGGVDPAIYLQQRCSK